MEIAFDKTARSVFCWPRNLPNLEVAAPPCQPMGRFGDPEDLTGTVHWLFSPAAAFMTGTMVLIDGGFSADSGA
jgi:NAD(P)-dependent dehydrogenase (short-subunit alcohol dehydrogenase family)